MIDALDHFATTVIDSARSHGPCHDAIEDMVGQDDSDGLAHYARKGEITRSYVMGIPVIALCGKRWLPSRLPDKLPICQTCSDIYNSLSD